MLHKELSAPVDRSRPAGLRCTFLVGCEASGALQASGSAENRQWPPAGLPEGRRRQCATLDQLRTMANSMLHDAAYPLLSVPVASNYLKVYWVWRFIDFHPHNQGRQIPGIGVLASLPHHSGTAVPLCMLHGLEAPQRPPSASYLWRLAWLVVPQRAIRE